jgi:hypothetical protein
MPISHRNRRMGLYSYSDTGSSGRRVQTFVKQASTVSDGDWWGSLVVPSGREVEVAANKGYQVDAVIGLAAGSPVTETGVVQDRRTGHLFKVTAVMARDMGRDELQVHGQRVDEADYQLDDFVAGWRDNSNIVLLSEARGQDTTQQIVRSTIGPDGWLGDTPLDAVNDPTYASDPDRWVFGETPDIGLSFGDALLSVLNDPSGFTVAAAVEMPDFITGFPASMSLVSKAAFPTENGLNFYVAAGRFSPGNTDQTNVVLQIKHNGTTGFTDYDRINGNTSAPIADPQVGQLEGGHVFGAHYDWSATRGARGSAWIDGVAIPGVDTVVGTDGPLVTTGPVRLAGDTDSSRNFKAGHLIVIARGVMPASWHADLYAEAVARGWA